MLVIDSIGMQAAYTPQDPPELRTNPTIRWRALRTVPLEATFCLRL